MDRFARFSSVTWAASNGRTYSSCCATFQHDFVPTIQERIPSVKPLQPDAVNRPDAQLLDVSQKVALLYYTLLMHVPFHLQQPRHDYLQACCRQLMWTLAQQRLRDVPLWRKTCSRRGKVDLKSEIFEPNGVDTFELVLVLDPLFCLARTPYSDVEKTGAISLSDRCHRR
eukprot:GHVO01025148.1.p1 GENE.GHVO01025148.1~~GHVO01025148.1.p1  ORF type:complete len:170 (+),score=5.65 GHVO01025148.1:1598-2107(+)